MSTDPTATGPGEDRVTGSRVPGAEAGRDALRASDEDRERVATELRDAHAEGRLTVEEFGERLDAVYAAKTYGELEPITRDLPRQRAASAGEAVPARPDDARHGLRALPASVRGTLGTSVLLIGIWGITCLGSGSLIYPWFVWPVGFLWLATVAGVVSGKHDGTGRSGSGSEPPAVGPAAGGGAPAARDQRRALREDRRGLRDDRRALRAQRRDERHGRAGR